jgi:hypothetical protein
MQLENTLEHPGAQAMTEGREIAMKNPLSVFKTCNGFQPSLVSPA